MLIFNEEKHEYRLNGKRVPSVTQLLQEYVRIEINGNAYYVHVGSETVIPAYVFERAGFIGSQLHAAVKLHIEGRLMWESLDVKYGMEVIDLKPMVMQFIVWERKHKPVYIMVEKPLSSAKHGFAGTPDIYADIIVGKKTVRVCIDIKTGLYEMVSVQLFGYETMIREETKYRGRIAPYVLSIPKDGSDYTFKSVEDRYAKQEFFSLLFDYKYRRRAT